jgi:sugar/nucleoside kinase (ribokinase family)
LVLEVVAVGRINIDVIMQVDKLQRRSQYLLSKEGQISFGGSAANFASQTSHLGIKTGLVGCLGNDTYGQMAFKHLQKVGIDTSQVLVLEKHPTGLYFIAYDEEGGEMVVAEPGANKFLDKRVLEEDYLIGTRVLHVAGGFPMMTKRAVDVATTEGMILSLDPGRAPASFEFRDIIKSVDLLFANQSDLRTHFKVTPSKKSLMRFAKTFPGILVVKQGKSGAVATDGFEYCTSDVFEVPVIDTLGAGDSFAAGFVTAWIRSEEIEQALHVANAVAALTLTKRGAQMGQPSLEEVISLLSEHGVSINRIVNTFRKPKRRKQRRRKAK